MGQRGAREERMRRRKSEVEVEGVLSRDAVWRSGSLAPQCDSESLSLLASPCSWSES
jgi:hypothetical protein